MKPIKDYLKENELLRNELAEYKERFKEEVERVNKMNDLLKITQDILLDKMGFDKMGRPRLPSASGKSRGCLSVAFRSNGN
jgi:hypothetical protein